LNLLALDLAGWVALRSFLSHPILIGLLLSNYFGDSFLGVSDIFVFEKLVLGHESVLGLDLVFLFLNNLVLRKTSWVNLLSVGFHFQFVRDVLVQIFEVLRRWLLRIHEWLRHLLVHWLA
jgi:hypothetical protein